MFLSIINWNVDRKFRKTKFFKIEFPLEKMQCVVPINCLVILLFQVCSFILVLLFLQYRSYWPVYNGQYVESTIKTNVWTVAGCSLHSFYILTWRCPNHEAVAVNVSCDHLSLSASCHFHRLLIHFYKNKCCLNSDGHRAQRDVVM